jgi:hypothetical protein
MLQTIYKFAFIFLWWFAVAYFASEFLKMVLGIR